MTATALPAIIYGTAWKKEQTARLVLEAVRAGFNAIDTANQPKHYDEPRLGEALLTLAREGVPRDRLFLQTKFTPADGHDRNIPYDSGKPFADQVAESFASSLRHLHTDYLDSYLLHGPYGYPGLDSADWEVWGAMERLARAGQARRIGISNVNARQLSELAEKAAVKPSFVQNRCYASSGWDAPVRAVCRAHGIVYQGFSLLTANPAIVGHPGVSAVARRLGATPEQVIYRFAIASGMIPLSGTTDGRHMREALASAEIELLPADVEIIAGLS